MQGEQGVNTHTHTHTRRGEDHLKPRAAMCTRKFTCS